MINEIRNSELLPDTLIEHSKTRKIELEQILRVIESALKAAPEGKLRIGRNGKSIQYFQRRDPTEKKGLYLNRTQKSLVSALVQKDYDSKLFNEIQVELQAIYRFHDEYHPERVNEIFRSLNEKRQSLVKMTRVFDDDFVRRWVNVTYEKKGFEEDAPEFYTARGERVRSKSEVLIADALNRLGIPYRYEYPIYIDGLGIVRPDFVCLNIRNGQEFLWEHFGMMSDPAYADNTINKLTKYLAAGYYPGKNALHTFETATRPLSTRVIERIIKEYLL